MTVIETNKRKAIYFQLTAVFLLVVMNMFAKILSETQATIAILFYRNVVSLFCILSYIVVTRQFARVKTSRPFLHVKRSVSGNIGVFTVFTAFSMLPMADMTALLLAAPLVATLLAAVLLKESITWQKICIILFGLLGVLIIVKPTGNVMLEAILVACLGVLLVAWINVQLRDMGKTEDPLTTVFYFFLFGSIVTSLFIPFFARPLSGLDYLFLGGCIFATLVSQLLKTEAMRHATVAVLTPLSYTGIIWATFFGWMIWSEYPDWTVLIGVIIIMSSSILNVRMDKKIIGV